LNQDIRFWNTSPQQNPVALQTSAPWQLKRLSLARRALKDKFPTPTVSLTTVLQNRQVFLPDPVFMTDCQPHALYRLISEILWTIICKESGRKQFWLSARHCTFCTLLSVCVRYEPHIMAASPRCDRLVVYRHMCYAVDNDFIAMTRFSVVG
jgi:hypothetical protein